MSIPQSGGGPITSKEQLAEYLESGCKPREDWRIGTEHEKFGYCRDTLKPLPYAGERSILTVLEGLRDLHGWAPLMEGGNLIGLEKDGANISLEPGGQLELSGAPLETIHETCDEVNAHLADVKDIADKVGVGFIGLGAAPIWRHEDMPQMPKGRYRLMNDYMDRVGTMGKSMMYRTCTVQVNLDFGSEADMVQKLRVALALQPVATALFANSPFFEGRPNGFKSWRARVWRDLDPARTVSRFPARAPAGAAGRDADAVGLGRSSDHHLPRGADQEIHGNARRRWRAVAAALRAARPLDRDHV